MKRVFLAASLLAFLSTGDRASAAKFPPFPGPYSKSGPVVMFESSRVVASNVRPGASVYFASLSVSSREHRVILQRPAAVIPDADGDGVVIFATTIDTRSLWLVVDGKSGGYTVSAPVGFLLRLIEVNGDVVRPGVGSALRRILSERNHVDIFLVRPGSGMWTANVKDGNDEDHDMNGTLIADLSVFRPLASSAPVPERIMPGDVLLIVDRNTFEFYAMKHEQGR